MGVFVTVVGALLILWGLRDMFHQLLHPPAHGLLWRLS